MKTAAIRSLLISSTFLLVWAGLPVLKAAAQSYTFTTLAGLAGVSGTNDGTGSAARFNNPYGVAVDSAGNVYVADTYNSTIRKITPGGVVSTLAGLAGDFTSADGTNSAARFWGPGDVAVDSAGNLYVADAGNDTIRKITPVGTNWVVSTLAGLARGIGSADGTNSDALFFSAGGVAVDGAGNVYVTDFYNDTIRKITPVGTNWVTSTLAGLARPCCNGGNAGSADGTNSDARFDLPIGVAVDSAGNVYVADFLNDTIRKITPIGTNWVTSTLAGQVGVSGTNDGPGSAARFSNARGVAVDSAGNVYVGDTGNSLIRKITPDGVVSTLAGVPCTGSADGTGSAARFYGPYGVAVDSAGNVYVADSGNNTIRKGVPSDAWIDGSGKWETDGNWSLGYAPSGADSVDLITNAGNNTVTIDSATATNAGGIHMTISDLTVSAPLNNTNTLFLNDAGTLSNPLLVMNSVTVGSGGVISVTNASLQVDAVGSMSGIDGVVVGVSGAGRQLNISGGLVSANFGYMGYNSSGSNNSVLVTGAGSVWSNRNDLWIGYNGPDNQLTVTNGGQVVNGVAWLGPYPNSSNNVVLVTGTGSVWRCNSDGLEIGYYSAGNQLTVANGGQVVVNGSGNVGAYSSSNNVALVTGPGSVWSNGYNLYVGDNGAGNQLTVANGGQVVDSSGYLGDYYFGSNNIVLVTGPGSVWSNSGIVYIGYYGAGNQLTVTNSGVVFANKLVLGQNAGSSGTLTLAGGAVNVAGLIVTNAGSVVVFNGGTLNSAGAAITNALAFAVGDGVDSATYQMLGGVHNFANGLRVRNNAALTGCGTINGNVLVDAGGTVLANCGGTTLNFTGAVTNNGNFAATGGTVLKFYSPVVNNGLIDGSGGDVQFFSTISNTGVILTPTNSWTDGSGKWETATNWSHATAPSSTDAANLITNAGNNTVTIDGTTAGSFPGTMTIRNLTVSAPGIATNTLFLNNVGTNTPLRVWGVLTLGTNAAMVVNNSAVLGTNSVSIGNSTASSSLVVSNGGSLIVTNGSGTGSVVVNGGSLILGTGTFKTDNLVVTNGGVVQHAQTYQVDNATVTIAGGSQQAGSNLVAGSSANSTGIVTVTDAGQLVVTNGVVGIGNSGTVTNGSGVGLMIVSNGTLLANQILLGSSVGGQGQLTVQTNGLVNLVGTNAELVANDLTVDGGDVEILNGQIFCGKLHPGAMTMSDGTANCRITYVGYDSQGTLTMGAGQMSVSSLLEIGFAAGSGGSVWISGGQLTATALATTIGDQGVGQMSISNGIVTMADVFVGNSSNPSTLILAGGTLTVNSLVLLNPSSQFNFTGGWLNALGITNSNGQTLTLGNGVSPVTLNLLGGISSLGNGLEISANATLTGCGTVNGNVTIDSGATVLANCGTLTFAGSLINNGTMRANGGSMLESYGTVVNNGTIDIINGATNFPGTFTNHGTVLTASSVRISQVSKSSPDMLIQIPSVTGHTYQLQYTTSLTPATWTPGASKPGGGVLTFTDTGGAANPQRFYRVAVTAP